MITHNGLRYKWFKYREVDWNTYKVLKEVVYPDQESFEIEKKCFELQKRNINPDRECIKEYHAFAYDVIDDIDDTVIFRCLIGDLDYGFYEFQKQ